MRFVCILQNRRVAADLCVILGREQRSKSQNENISPRDPLDEPDDFAGMLLAQTSRCAASSPPPGRNSACPQARPGYQTVGPHPRSPHDGPAFFCPSPWSSLLAWSRRATTTISSPRTFSIRYSGMPRDVRLTSRILKRYGSGRRSDRSGSPTRVGGFSGSSVLCSARLRQVRRRRTQRRARTRNHNRGVWIHDIGGPRHRGRTPLPDSERQNFC